MKIFVRRNQINFWCVFKNKEIEQSFENQSYKSNKKLLSYFYGVILCSAFIICLADILIFTNNTNISFLPVIALCAVCIIPTYLMFKRIKRAKDFYLVVCVTEITFSAFFLFMLSPATGGSFIVKCCEISVLLTIFSSFSHRWTCTSLISLLLFAGFIAFYTPGAKAYFGGSSVLGIICVSIIFIFNTINSYRLNYLRRTKYYETMMLKKLINIDTLTGAYTRAKFNEDIDSFINKAAVNGKVFSIMIFDIDNFKHINDTYGHLAGDSVLTQIVEIVVENKRSEDILTRWGGEEFILLLPETEKATAKKVAERLRDLIATYNFEKYERITCSFGVTQFRANDTDTTLIRRADKLMYDAKSAGKNLVVSD